MFHTENVKVLDVTVQILVATATLLPGFVHPCLQKVTLLVAICTRQLSAGFNP